MLFLSVFKNKQNLNSQWFLKPYSEHAGQKRAPSANNYKIAL